MMFRNYFQTTFRNILANKVYAFINIFGLAIGLAACVLIMLFVRDEFSYDTQWQNAESIYQVNTTFSFPGSAPVTSARVTGRAKENLSLYFPEEIAAVARINRMRTIVGHDGDVFAETIHWTDPELLDVFNFDVVAGDLTLALSDNASIALSQSMAKKYFGDDNPVGQTLELSLYEIKRDYRIAAVFNDLPQNTTLEFQALVMIDETDFEGYAWEFQDWYSANGWTYIKLQRGVGADYLNGQMKRFVNDNIEVPAYVTTEKGASASDFWNFSVQKITEIQLEAKARGLMKPAGDIVKVMTFITIAGLILLVACINFINLSTAKATKRAREVALRKVLGARRAQLVMQYLGESILLVLVSLMLGLVMVELTLPTFAGFLGKELMLDYTDAALWQTLAALVLGVGTLAGIYPALVITGSKPAHVLKANKSAETTGSVSLRQALVVFQFAISIGLIVATGVIYGQMHYSTNMDIGYNKNNLLSVLNIDRDSAADIKETLRDEVARMPEVTSVSLSGFRPVGNFGVNRSVKISNEASDGISLANQLVDHDFFNTFQIPLLAGRTYDRAHSADGLPSAEGAKPGDLLQGTVVLNKAAIAKIGYGTPDQAIGKVVRVAVGRLEGDTIYADLEIIGVVADMLFHQLRTEKRAEGYYLEQDGYRGSLVARFEGDPTALVQRIGTLWKSLAPTLPFQYEFVDDLVADSFTLERHLAALLGTFAGLAIAIACLGLFGLASFTAERRIKEIGIRKVLGATVRDIVQLLVWQFSKPVLLANLIAWPIATWSMMRWLETFPYRMDFWYLLPLCLIASFTTLAVAWATVGGNAAKVARTNPIKALRYE